MICLNREYGSQLNKKLAGLFCLVLFYSFTEAQDKQDSIRADSSSLANFSIPFRLDRLPPVKPDAGGYLKQKEALVNDWISGIKAEVAGISSLLKNPVKFHSGSMVSEGGFDTSYLATVCRQKKVYFLLESISRI